MHRSPISSSFALCVCFFLICATTNFSIAGEGTPTVTESQAQTAASVVGTWRLQSCELAKKGNAAAVAGINTRMKIYNSTHWVVIQSDMDSGSVQFVLGGTYKLNGVEMEERVDFAGSDTSDLIGNTTTFRIQLFDNGTFEQLDEKGVFSAVWRRAGHPYSDAFDDDKSPTLTSKAK